MLMVLALAKVTQRLNINAVFPEFLFHRQCLFGCKVTKFPTKAFIARQEKVHKPTRNSLSVNCFLLVTILSETWLCISSLEIYPTVFILGIIALETEGCLVGIVECGNVGVGHIVTLFVVFGGQLQAVALLAAVALGTPVSQLPRSRERTTQFKVLPGSYPCICPRDYPYCLF